MNFNQLNDTRNIDKLLSNLSPNKIEALERSIKEYHQKSSETEEFEISLVKMEPISKPLITQHKTKNRGLTYENGRRNLKHENCSPEEMERRQKRRERNRVAAAKCREKRQNQMDILRHQVELLHREEMSMKQKIDKLNREEEELKRTLRDYNCMVAESQNGEINIIMRAEMLQNNNHMPHNILPNPQNIHRNIVPMVPPPLNLNPHNNCRPKSLPVPNQNLQSTLPDETTPSTIDPFSLINDPKTELSLTPLLSPDTYKVLRNQMKSEPQLNSLPEDNKMHVETPEKDQTPDKSIFSWNNSIIDHLAVTSIESSGYLTTPNLLASSNSNFNQQIV